MKNHTPMKNHIYFLTCDYKSCLPVTYDYPLDGADLVAVRGLIHQEVPIRVRQRGELN